MGCIACGNRDMGLDAAGWCPLCRPPQPSLVSAGAVNEGNRT